MSKFKVVLVGNPETDNKGAVLGISEERFEVLADVMAKAIKSTKTTIEAISKMSKHAQHANELCFMIESIVLYHERRSNPFNKLAEIISRAKKA